MPAPLIALATALCYASALVSARRGLRYSTPATVTCVSVVIQTVTLWSAVFITGGVPEVAPLAVGLFVIAGFTQLGVRFFAYTGVQKIGASRSSTLQSISPLISAVIAIPWLGESVSAAVLTGTFLVVIGIISISWRAEETIADFRWWHMLIPVGAACLTGVNHPLRRYALTLSNEPLFFAALMGSVSLSAFVAYRVVSPRSNRLVWTRSAWWPFLVTGASETVSILLIITALSVGPVVVVAPIASTYPVWALLGTVVFLREFERVNTRTVFGTLCVVAGTIAIHLGHG